MNVDMEDMHFLIAHLKQQQQSLQLWISFEMLPVEIIYPEPPPIRPCLITMD